MTEEKAKISKRISRRTVEVELSKVSEAPDQTSRLEESAFDSQVELDRARIISLRQDTNERKKYAPRIFYFLCIWIGLLFLLLFAQGLAYWTHFSLSEHVLLAIIGGTTADVLGLFYIVTRYLFPSIQPQRRTAIWSPISTDDDVEDQRS